MDSSRNCNAGLDELKLSEPTKSLSIDFSELWICPLNYHSAQQAGSRNKSQAPTCVGSEKLTQAESNIYYSKLIYVNI